MELKDANRAIRMEIMRHMILAHDGFCRLEVAEQKMLKENEKVNDQVESFKAMIDFMNVHLGIEDFYKNFLHEKKKSEIGREGHA